MSNEGLLWHQDPPYVADYMNFYLDKTKRLLGVGADHVTLKALGATNGPIPLKVGTRWFLITSDAVISTATDMDTGAIAAGLDYYVYACDNNGVIDYVISLNSTYPAGYTAQTSRKIGGFHTLSANVGTISGHDLTGYLAVDIIPGSIWDIKHRARNLNNAGLVYDDRTQLWIQIYLASDDGASGVQSVNGATILDTIDWNSFVERGGVKGMRLLTDPEFQIAVRGCNEETNITGSADPVTTGGGHVDTAARRMISNIGLEDAAGVLWQWLQDNGYRWDMVDANMTPTAAGATATVTHAASPGGNQVYLKYDASGHPYLCCNMASAGVDKYITFGTNQKMAIKHDANANAGLPVYINKEGTDPSKILVNNTINGGKNTYIYVNYTVYSLQMTHDASATTNGVALNYDDGADNRLEATFSPATNTTFDICYFAPSFAYYNLADSVGSVYRQGVYGDVKLLAGGYWYLGSDAGSRSRIVHYPRWFAYSLIGGRFAVPGL